MLRRHNLATIPDRVNFVVLIKKTGSCFLITSEFSTQFKTSIFFVSLVLINLKKKTPERVVNNPAHQERQTVKLGIKHPTSKEKEILNLKEAQIKVP